MSMARLRMGSVGAVSRQRVFMSVGVKCQKGGVDIVVLDFSLSLSLSPSSLTPLTISSIIISLTSLVPTYCEKRYVSKYVRTVVLGTPSSRKKCRPSHEGCSE